MRAKVCASTAVAAQGRGLGVAESVQLRVEAGKADDDVRGRGGQVVQSLSSPYAES